MKNKNTSPPPYSTSSSSTSAAGEFAGKGKRIMFNEIEDSGVDELLAVLGYKVKPSDMDDVAQKIEHLEGVFGNDDFGNISQIVSDTNHLNPSDLNSWLESMMCEVNGNGVTGNGNETENENVFSDDLQAIVYPPSKKLKQNRSPTHAICYNNPNPSNPNNLNTTNVNDQNHVVLVDSQENGIRLVHTLMACAEAIQQEKFSLAENLVKQSGILAVSQTGAMRKVATYFAEGLARRIYGLKPVNTNDSPAFLDLLQMHFYETCPYLKFAHFTANQAILEAVNGKSKVHVIDFGMKQGMQWPALMQALALRPGGPPSFRLTGIGPPAGDNTDYLQEVGWKLAQLAETIHVEFEFRGFVAASLADLEPEMFNLRNGEVVAVNSVFELHQLLARPGSVEKVLSTVKQIKPVVFTVVEQEANHNGLVFLDRFTESLHYYSTLFDSLESSGSGAGAGTGTDVMFANDQDRIMSEIYLGKQICNVVACEGVDRVERHETLTQWKTRLDSSGFEPVHLGSNAFKQASMLLALFAGGDGYRVEENYGCLMLGWHTRPLITTSAWKIR